MLLDLLPFLEAVVRTQVGGRPGAGGVPVLNWPLPLCEQRNESWSSRAVAQACCATARCGWPCRCPTCVRLSSRMMGRTSPQPSATG